MASKGPPVRAGLSQRFWVLDSVSSSWSSRSSMLQSCWLPTLDSSHSCPGARQALYSQHLDSTLERQQGTDCWLVDSSPQAPRKYVKEASIFPDGEVALSSREDLQTSGGHLVRIWALTELRDCSFWGQPLTFRATIPKPFGRDLIQMQGIVGISLDALFVVHFCPSYWYRVLCSQEWPCIPDHPISTSQVLGFWLCDSMPGFTWFYWGGGGSFSFFPPLLWMFRILLSVKSSIPRSHFGTS